MKTIALLSFLLLGASVIFGQTTKNVTKVIQTSAECGSCKERIEKELNYTKGIQFAELDVPSKKLTVKFNPTKITLDTIYARITALGYNADDHLADEKAMKELPKCCQPGGMEEH